MGVTVVTYIKPAKAGFLVTFWWLPPSNDEWRDIIDQVTDSAGKTSFVGFTFPSWPAKCRVTVPAQIVDGDSYKECISSDIIIDNYETISRILYPELVEALEPYLEEVYRDVEIWWKPSISAFTAEVTPLYKAAWPTLPEMRAWIDEILLLLYPPEDPEEGLFAQITAAVKAWVVDLMPGWVLEWGSIVNNYLTEVYETITNVYNDFHEYVTNVYNNTYETIQNVYQDLRTYITEVYNDTYQYVTNNITNINENITNIIGVSQNVLDNAVANLTSFINGKLVEWDSTGFLANPLVIISGVFAASRLAAEYDIIERFWLGFEEGLVSEEEG